MLSLPLLCRMENGRIFPDVFAAFALESTTHARVAEDSADAAFVRIEDCAQLTHREGGLLACIPVVLNLFGCFHIQLPVPMPRLLADVGQVLRLAGGRGLTVVLCHLQFRPVTGYQNAGVSLKIGAPYRQCKPDYALFLLCEIEAPEVRNSDHRDITSSLSSKRSERAYALRVLSPTRCVRHISASDSSTPVS